MDQAFDIVGLFVVGAIVVAVVAHPATKGIINSFGVAFDNSLVSAEGFGHIQKPPA